MTPGSEPGRPLADGPKVVAIGGGHGLAATLRAVRTYTDRVTAIVSVADDGGSSGRLRELLEMIPPGDLRKCLVALAEPGSPLAAAFEYRFGEEELAGHSLGNLILAGLLESCGDPVAALDEACRLLGVRGRVLPSATEPVVLKAEAAGGPVAGQVAVNGTDHIRTVSLVPADPKAPRAEAGGPRPMPTRSSWVRARCSPACWRRWPFPMSGRASTGRRPSGSTSATCGLRSPRPPVMTSAMHVDGPGGPRRRDRPGAVRFGRDRRRFAAGAGGGRGPGPPQRDGPRPVQTGVRPLRSARMMAPGPGMPYRGRAPLVEGQETSRTRAACGGWHGMR